MFTTPCTPVKDGQQPYVLEVGGVSAGYGSILIGGPWTGTRTLFEFYVIPAFRSHALDLFGCLIAASDATAMKAQTNDVLLAAMMYTWAKDIKSEKIVFEDKLTTSYRRNDAVFDAGASRMTTGLWKWTG